jgi:hypothetical protein
MERSQTLMFSAQFAASQLFPPSAQFPHFHEAPPLFEGNARIIRMLASTRA